LVMDSRLIQRAVLIYLTIAGLLVGVWAALLPRAFYDDFPGVGRVWVSVDGPYNEHLVRDVGQLSLALALVTLAAAVTMQQTIVRLAGGAVLLNGLPHLVYHLRHLDKYGTADKVGNVVSLGLLVVLPIVVLALSWASSRNSLSHGSAAVRHNGRRSEHESEHESGQERNA
jgi:hypothetical protein